MTQPVRSRDLILYFAKLGATKFGGPIALTSAMQADLVDQRKWFTQETFQEGMVLSQLAPGPLATQLSIYFGWAHSGVKGATLTGLAFVLPSFLMVVLLAMLYIRFGSMPLIQNLFHGIAPAVIAIICLGAHKLSRKNLGSAPLLWTIAIFNAVITIATQSEIIWIFLLSGAVVPLLRLQRNGVSPMAILPVELISGMTSGLHGPATNKTLLSIFMFFLKSGAFVFGSGLAIVPFLHGGVVNDYHWLTEGQFLDAVAIAMITPGPVVITVGFIGFLIAGFAGALLAALGTFLPCYLFTVIPAPHFAKISKHTVLKEFISGVTAAAIGAIGGAVVILAQKSIVDLPTIAIFALTLPGLLFFKKVPEPLWILIAGIVGLLL